VTATPLIAESQLQGGFYAPHFEVTVGGSGLPKEVVRDVTQITYRDGIAQLDSFEITVSNWDPGTGRFKYVGSETAAALQSSAPESASYRLFEPSEKKRVEVRMGYLDSLRVMLTGTITTMEPGFRSSGAPTLTVRGLNALQALRSKQYSKEWFGLRDSEIAQNIATLNDQTTGRKRFPLPIDIDPNAIQNEPPLDYVAERSQYDIDFLFGRARTRGYVLFVQEADPTVSGSKQRLYFGPPNTRIPGLRPVTFRLEWGKSLMEFNPTLTTVNQVQSVTVVGHNRRTKTQIRETVTLDDQRFTANRDLFALVKAGDREHVVVNEPVFTPRQARERAYAILLDRVRSLVKVTATTIGLPDLRAGQLVEIVGLGSRFSGTYFITDTTHTIGDGGYTTRFEARREDLGQGGRR
jgi:phage protein D